VVGALLELEVLAERLELVVDRLGDLLAGQRKRVQEDSRRRLELRTAVLVAEDRGVEVGVVRGEEGIPGPLPEALEDLTDERRLPDVLGTDPVDLGRAGLDLHLGADEGLELVLDLPVDDPHRPQLEEVGGAEEGCGLGIEDDEVGAHGAWAAGS